MCRVLSRGTCFPVARGLSARSSDRTPRAQREHNSRKRTSERGSQGLVAICEEHELYLEYDITDRKKIKYENRSLKMKKEVTDAVVMDLLDKGIFVLANSKHCLSSEWFQLQRAVDYIDWCVERFVKDRNATAFLLNVSN
ncbi:hypothetical protein NDU88_000722 [Pleurodeles waltl]|uniref:Uncharacterized protein n=1 Tax=Pleurodeles waltl TaxID=8319 RepID=A0AAV7LYC2_PLEWA|nr:hypothetical protein NDU88_000722 [Pleurodeles waltl]